MKVFGVTLLSAFYIALLFGVLIIPVTYCLGALAMNRKVGLLASLFISMDPMTIISSQKVWMDTAIAFFVVLSLYYFAKGLKTNKNSYLQVKDKKIPCLTEVAIPCRGDVGTKAGNGYQGQTSFLSEPSITFFALEGKVE